MEYMYLFFLGAAPIYFILNILLLFISKIKYRRFFRKKIHAIPFLIQFFYHLITWYKFEQVTDSAIGEKFILYFMIAGFLGFISLLVQLSGIFGMYREQER